MNKIYIADGNCIFHDPGPEMLPIFLSIDNNYKIMSVRPGNDFRPRFQLLKERHVILESAPLEYEPSYLFDLFNNTVTHAKGDRYSVLDILYAITLMGLQKCSLCGWKCGVNRFLQEKGKCGLGSTVFTSRPFVHIAEEAVINPSVVTNMGGCALRCKYCIDHELWDTSKLVPFDPRAFWGEIQGLVIENGGSINSIEFSNATESVHSIVSNLLDAPGNFRLPVVLNTHLYGSQFFYNIADYITDVWLVDLRYGNNDCASSLSGVNGYMEQATQGLDAICKEGNRVIVRILVLPGHVSCCHMPSIKFLTQYKEFVWVSILDQYIPENEAHIIPGLSRRPTREEIEDVENMVGRYGLRNISTAGREFWN